MSAAAPDDESSVLSVPVKELIEILTADLRYPAVFLEMLWDALTA